MGRDAQLDAVRRFFDDVGAGPTLLLLSGEAGIGKTTVWELIYRSRFPTPLVA